MDESRCDCCGHKNVETHEFRISKPKRKMNLCRVCYNTGIWSTNGSNPQEHSKELKRMIAWCTNEMLQALRR